ncbi:His-Xaa-Ser repeat protein HxsA [Marinobacter sp.]|uniref:His-Xaa-Ser repeat protein HxsA n=1 Tax=Marinobacter sp. TaxID=50741 RepID=UPI003A8D16B0
MSRFIKSLSMFVAGAALANTETEAAQHDVENSFTIKFEPTSLRPLNFPGDNMYAAHRSHASHSSHSSHRSSSGSYSAPKSKPSPSRRYSAPSGNSQSVDPGRPATVTPSTRDTNAKVGALQNLIKRVQIALIIQGYSPGATDGRMGPQTREALKRFQKDKGLKVDGLMSTETLNALGVAL